jgi:hypothetical protein
VIQYLALLLGLTHSSGISDSGEWTPAGGLQLLGLCLAVRGEGFGSEGGELSEGETLGSFQDLVDCSN